nr:MAG TPA: Repressor protein CI [Caudoviricetes sp.]
MSDEAQKRIFSKNLRRLLEESGKTQKELAEAIGESQQVVNTWAIGRSIPRMGRVQKLADFFGVEKSVLVDEWREGEEPQIPQFSNIFPISKKRMPIPGKIACGKPISCNEDRESYIVAGTDVPADFCLKARGDSMTGARIMDGDIVFIRKDAELVNGGIYAVEIDDEATLKRVYYDEAAQELRLLAENPKYPTMVYSGERLAHVHVLGKAIAFQSDVI